ncbi:MAG: HK97 gp10 family phage protein [Ignavibacteriaceae bacterium]|nr:HK97 gp10 family phage protein [Ignavibacteriaceae bacterium]
MPNKEFFELEDEILKRFRIEVERLTEKIGLIIERETKAVLAENEKIATGDLRKSIRYKVTKLVSAYLITCFANVKYSQYVYDGTRPHFPPIEPIVRWVQRKGIGQSFSIKSHKMVGSNRKGVAIGKRRIGLARFENLYSEKSYSEEVRSVAYAIARSMAKKGTHGLKFFDIALKQAWPAIEKEVQAFNLKNL